MRCAGVPLLRRRRQCRACTCLLATYAGWGAFSTPAASWRTVPCRDALRWQSVYIFTVVLRPQGGFVARGPGPLGTDLAAALREVGAGRSSLFCVLLASGRAAGWLVGHLLLKAEGSWILWLGGTDWGGSRMARGGVGWGGATMPP